MPGNFIKDKLQGGWGASLVFLISGVLAAASANTIGALVHANEWVNLNADWEDKISLSGFIDSFNRHSWYLDFSKQLDPSWDLAGKILLPGLFTTPIFMRGGGGGDKH